MLKKIGIMKSGLDGMPLFLLDDLLKGKMGKWEKRLKSIEIILNKDSL